METHTVKASEGAVGGLEHSSAPLRLPVVLEDKHPSVRKSEERITALEGTSLRKCE